MQTLGACAVAGAWCMAGCLGHNYYLTLSPASPREHSEVFKEGVGELRGVKAKLYIDKDERPRPAVSTKN